MGDAVVPIFTAEPLLLDAYNNGQSSGFALFGPEHLVWIVICAALIVAAVRWYRHLFKKERAAYARAADAPDASGSGTGQAASANAAVFAGETPGANTAAGSVVSVPQPGGLDTAGRASASLRFLRVLAAIMLLGLITEDALKISANVFTAPWWPLHWCNFAELFCLIYVMRPNRICRELMLTIGLSGGFIALLFPAWSYCPPYTWPAISGFVQHSMIFAISLCAVSDWHTSPRWRDVWFTAGFVGLYALVFRWFNGAFGTNFGFVTTPLAGTPLAWWADAFGNPGYLVPFALVFAAAAVLLHAAVARQRCIGSERANAPVSEQRR